MKALELKQDENHGIVKLQLETQVEIEAQHHLLFLLVPSPALFFLLVAEGITINTKDSEQVVRYLFLRTGKLYRRMNFYCLSSSLIHIVAGWKT